MKDAPGGEEALSALVEEFPPEERGEPSSGGVSHEAGEEPWASMYKDGHGEHWDQTADYIARHESVWRRVMGR